MQEHVQICPMQWEIFPLRHLIEVSTANLWGTSIVLIVVISKCFNSPCIKCFNFPHGDHSNSCLLGALCYSSNKVVVLRMVEVLLKLLTGMRLVNSDRRGAAHAAKAFVFNVSCGTKPSRMIQVCITLGWQRCLRNMSGPMD